MRSHPAFWAACLLGASAIWSTCAARPTVLTCSPPGAPSVASTLADGARQRGWPFHLNEPIASPFFHDVNGDGIDEVIIADGSRAYVLDATGNPLTGWPRAIPYRADNCGAAADLDGDGAVEIAFGIEGAPPLLYVYQANGANEPGWPVQLPYRYWMNCSSPVIADLNNDGALEIGIGVEVGVAFFDARGHSLPGWPFTWFTTQNLAWSAPVVGDIDGDGRNEVVVGENTLGSSGVYAIRADGTLMPGWPKQTSTVFSSPSLGDLDGDGVLEIVAQDGDPTWMGYHLYVWNGDGSDVPGFPMSITTEWNGSRANPAISDVDGDGSLEIVTVTSDGYLHVIRSNGTDYPGYPRMLPGTDLISSPQTSDVNGDGLQEIFQTYIASGGAQYVSGWRLNGMTLPGFPKLLLASSQLAVHGSAHVKDINGDGVFEIVACGTDFSNGSCCLFTVDQSHYDPISTRCEWPKIRRDPMNGGIHPWRNPAGAAGVADIHALPFRIGPNPVVPEAEFNFYVPGDAAAQSGRITILDAMGRMIADREIALGGAAGVVRGGPFFNGARPAAGIYFVRFRPAGAGEPRDARLVLLGR